MRVVNIDIDGVLADFEAEYERVTGHPFVGSGTPQERWDRLRGHEVGFYAGIRPFIGAKEFVRDIIFLQTEEGFNIRILSALPSMLEFPTAWYEKVRWVSNHIDPYLSVCIARSSHDKQNWARPGDILIDDNPLNVRQWSEAGGISHTHTDFDTSLAFIKEKFGVQQTN